MSEELTAAHLAEDVLVALAGVPCWLDGAVADHTLSPAITPVGNVLAVDVVRPDGTVLRTAKITVELL